jgi:hypothetical protein
MLYTGCYKGWWGSDCSKTCPATCVDRHCYPSNGRCVWGCDPVNCLNDIKNRLIILKIRIAQKTFLMTSFNRGFDSCEWAWVNTVQY